MSHPTNDGRICVRGWHVHEVASSPDRLQKPLIREGTGFREADWDEALGFVARRLTEIRERHGPNSIAFLNSPRCSNEESYLLQKLARAVIGTNNVDHGAGVYSNNSEDVLLEMLGIPATTNSVGELSSCETIIVDGVDLGRQLPTIGGRIIRAKLAGAKLIVIDSRRHRIGEHADRFLQIRPATEGLLYGAMAKVLVDRGLIDLPFIRERCEGCGELLASLAEYDLLGAARGCGVPPEQIEGAALDYAHARRAAILYSTGAESRDAASIRAIVNLTLLTGHIGAEGTGIYALAEHNNLQGVCDMGMHPARLPGYRSVRDSAARDAIGKAWGAPLPDAPGIEARALLTEPAAPGIQALWIDRYDPVNTACYGDPEALLRRCELVVTQHLFMTGTTALAHVILPTSAFGEEQVTFTSTDRRIQVAAQVLDGSTRPPPAWQQIMQVARLMGADWRYGSAADVMEEIGRVVPFYSGASHDNLLREYGRQWPCTTDRPLGTRFLFGDPQVERRFRFVPVPRPELEPQPADYPLTAAFSHSLYYWHRNLLIRHSETLKREYSAPLLDFPGGFVEINPDDARDAGVRDGDQVRLASESGSAVTAAHVTPEVRPGAVFVPYFVRQVQRLLRGSPANDVRAIPVRLEKVAA